MRVTERERERERERDILCHTLKFMSALALIAVSTGESTGSNVVNLVSN